MSELESALHFFRTYIDAIASSTVVLTAVLTLRKFVIRKYRAYADRKNLQLRVGAELYTKAEILRATEFFVEPDCQSLDPSGAEDFRKTYALRQSAFQALDQLLCSSAEYRYSILLGDSGMGKTTLLLNYYARNYRRKHRLLNIQLVPLGYKDADSLISKAQERSNSILFLDAFDEDTKAIENHRERLSQLLSLSEGFAHVLVSCRTQFFEKDLEIPRETGIVRFGATGPGESREYYFYKLYLSPFSDQQVETYLRKRFPFWQRQRRTAAREIARKMPDLTVRPMLLANIEDLLGSSLNYKYSVQVYEAMIEAWLRREGPFVNPAHLRIFSELLAIDIYAKRIARASERIPPTEALKLASKEGVPLQGWQLRSRSLLNRDELGNLKFAHRTIMEYLFVRRFIREPRDIPKTLWTDQMKRFWWELVGVGADQATGHLRDSGLAELDSVFEMPGVHLASSTIWLDLQNADLEGLESLHIRPIRKYQSAKSIRTEAEALEVIREYCERNITYDRWSRRYVPFARRIPAFPGTEREKDSAAFVVDFASGLMWAANWSCESNFFGASEHLRRLATQRWGGYSDWRLPTLAEACSLFPDNSTFQFAASAAARYPQDLFTDWNDVIWTSESTEYGRGLQVRYDAVPFPCEFSATKTAWVRPVRTIS